MSDDASVDEEAANPFEIILEKADCIIDALLMNAAVNVAQIRYRGARSAPIDPADLRNNIIHEFNVLRGVVIDEDDNQFNEDEEFYE